MPEEYEIVPADPIRKLENEVEELKKYLNSLKEEISELYNKKSGSSREDFAIYYMKMTQEIINSLIRNNIELQSKLAELIVSTNELNREIKKLVEIFKEAAVEYMQSFKNKKEEKENKDVEKLMEKIQEMEKLNARIVDAIDNLTKQLEELKKKDQPKQKPPVKPPFPPPFIPNKV